MSPLRRCAGASGAWVPASPVLDLRAYDRKSSMVLVGPVRWWANGDVREAELDGVGGWQVRRPNPVSGIWLGRARRWVRMRSVKCPRARYGLEPSGRSSMRLRSVAPVSFRAATARAGERRTIEIFLPGGRDGR